MMALRAGDFILDFIGPLGCPATYGKLDGHRSCWWPASASRPFFPQLREYKKAGNRTLDCRFPQPRPDVLGGTSAANSAMSWIVTTDDGSYGRKGFVSHALAYVIGANRERARGGGPLARFP